MRVAKQISKDLIVAVSQYKTVRHTLKLLGSLAARNIHTVLKP